MTAAAQEPDRTTAAIRSVISELNQARKDSDAKAVSELFTRDGSLAVGNQILASGQTEIENLLQDPVIWSEVTAPSIQIESLRFVFPGVALVDATQVQFGSLLLKKSAPITLLLKLDWDTWRIVSLWIQPAMTYPFPVRF